MAWVARLLRLIVRWSVGRGRTLSSFQPNAVPFSRIRKTRGSEFGTDPNRASRHALSAAAGRSMAKSFHSMPEPPEAAGQRWQFVSRMLKPKGASPEGFFVFWPRRGAARPRAGLLPVELHLFGARL